ncbi:TIGR03790 family protein [Oxalobacteraceae bacterium A2-2]
MQRITLLLAGLLLPATGEAQFVKPVGLQAAQLALIINDEDAASVAAAEYYQKVYAVPARNLVHVRIPDRPRKLSVEQFAPLKEQIDSKLGPDVQAVLMVWTAPYAVDCNSITSAYTLGVDSALCAKPCDPSQPSRYYNSGSRQPFKDLGLRPSMLLPAESLEQAKALIDRGHVSSFRPPAATAWFLVTSDKLRSSRAPFFPRSGLVAQKKLTIKTVYADSLENEKDIMVYQTGRDFVPKLDTLHFVPGALADHLTSVGGDLLSDKQMSALRWLEAGATASYGSVSEPCNYWQKFPNSSVLLRHYLSGNTAIEAYWKSVAWPAQGLFIGDPLAAPYRN